MRPARLAAALLAAAPALASARWDVVVEAPTDVDAEAEVAVVSNDSGHSLRVYRDDGGVVQAVFSIREGFDTLSDALCPTYQVDEEPPIATGLAGECALDAKRARFSLGVVEEDRVIRSDALLELMNGSRLAFRYRIPSLGYRETTFSLKGSKQALNRAIGVDVAVVEE